MDIAGNSFQLNPIDLEGLCLGPGSPPPGLPLLFLPSTFLTPFGVPVPAIVLFELEVTAVAFEVAVGL